MESYVQTSQTSIRSTIVTQPQLRRTHFHEQTVLRSAKGPLQLLDLPVDLLSAIVREVTHTNDLASLALTHSALHRLVIPHIYSRFDIVWPEANPTIESRVGVDALTYGLATLVMAHDVFGEAEYQQECHHCKDCEHNQRHHRPRPQIRVGSNVRVRRGNYFAQHTRKFSLGNGPADWVQEYLITKEGGKMLGTLVALALGRMRNLEAFIWDMPTGVLRDVWLALASLGNRNDGRECRLEKVWVRWHDNRDSVPLSSPTLAGSNTHHSSLPTLLHGTASSLFHIPAYPSVEFPTFSILPPLKSITCLDIDEVSYAEELSILLERSVDLLEELRIGVAHHAQRRPLFRPLEDRSAVPSSTFPESSAQISAGGIVGVLLSRLCRGLQTTSNTDTCTTSISRGDDVFADRSSDLHSTSVSKNIDTLVSIPISDVDQLEALLSEQTLDEVVDLELTPTPKTPIILKRSERSTVPVYGVHQKDHDRRLRLRTLELERMYLSIPVLSRGIEWSKLESITLLGCTNHEALWKALRKTFAPASVRQKTPSSRLSSLLGQSRSNSSSYTIAEPPEYKLNIKRLHTDCVSKGLLAFIKDTLAPDTLEWLFLQETPGYKSTITIDEIYRSAVKRHRQSLRKLLIDSELRQLPHQTNRERERQSEDTNWRHWTANQDLISCITSGKMQLRELSICLDYRHWHFFLQRLPNASSLRSLHISRIAEHPYGRSFDPREIALQILDIISLRPDIELCYLGIEKKCFEILEYKASRTRNNFVHLNSSYISTLGPHQADSTLQSASDSEDHDDGGTAQHFSSTHPSHHIEPDHAEDDDNDSWDINSVATSDVEHNERTDDSEDQDDEVDPSKGSHRPAFRLREILFYDDKISIFRARHGKL